MSFVNNKCKSQKVYLAIISLQTVYAIKQ